ncbi:DUF397 domain-containing protein [Streptomyces sp. NPDC051569]|uniref:DUF397 domain-containing protein n=1 Tax=Streptomyces sp. NPDC051569 TaxID=3365661 RepID=UPI003796C6D5
MGGEQIAPAQLVWFKSSFSGTSGGDCLEVAVVPNVVHVRDSKSVRGAVLRVPAAGWSAFVSYVRPTVKQHA